MNKTLDAILVYVHPSVMIAGYILIIICFIFLFLERRLQKNWRFTKISLYLAWFFNLLGLLTGMLWAVSAWGSYWSWDPKETTTLLLFLFVCFSVIFYEKRKNLSYLLLAQSLLFIIINILITLSSVGLHGHGT
jgi:ABC-type transport system involved in cytochrome c biogenesis permease subunit